MKKSVLMMAVFIASILSVNHVKAQTTNKSAANSGGAINIKVPDFANPEVNKYYHAYTANFIEYVKAIRQKDKVKANAAMEKDIQFYIQASQIDEKVEPSPAELQKATDLLSQLNRYRGEIMNSEYWNEEGRRMREIPGFKN